MTSQPFDFTPSKPQDSETGGGLAIAGMLMLPEAEQQLITWMIRQGEVTVAEAIAYTGRDEATVRQMLNTLLQAGFLQTSERSGITHYSRAAFAAKPGRQLDAQIWQSLAPGSPLAVIRNPSGDLVVVAGSPPIDLCITLSNQGNQSALIDVFLDESQPVYSWCLNPRDRLALGPQQSGEVVFQFQVPVQTVPSLYTYSLVVDAPDHYPEDTPIQFTQRLQVLPPIQEAMRVHDPSFVLQPATSSTKPAALQPGQTLEVFVFVHNRSNRVDRFRLTCPDLPETWFTIRYPEGLDTPGLVLETDGLALNPDGRGQILLLIHPPIAAPAGVYSPNVQLHSANLPDLVLMDLVYVQILPAYFLNIELRTLLGRVRRGIGQYEIRLLNEGNTDRAVQLHIEAADEEDLCVYTLEPASVLVLPPKSSTTLNLQVEPTKWWRRPLYGGGRLINFFVEVSDQQQLPLPNDRFRETLIWEPRPWWQFWLLVLTVLGSVAAIVFLLWWIVFRPPAVPKIVEFSSDDPAYQEANGDFIRLNWQIRNPDQIQAIRLTSQSPEGGAASKPITYSFSQGIPGELKEYCVVQQLLICKGVRTDARKVGNYLFELAVIPKQGEAVDTQKIGPVQIQSTQPAIVFFRIDGKDIKIGRAHV